MQRVKYSLKYFFNRNFELCYGNREMMLAHERFTKNMMCNLVDVVRDIHLKGYVYNELHPRKIFIGLDKDIYFSS